MLEDKLLIWKLNRGNREVLRRIYEKYKNYLVTLATALLYNKTDAEDVVHNVFVSLIKSSERFRLTGSLRSYLATCVVNDARNKNKASSRRQNPGLDDVDTVTSYSVGPEQSAIFGEELMQLNRALAQLPYEQREVVILHLYSGMRFAAIANLQSISINTVQGRYRYGLNKLRPLTNVEVKK